MTETSLSLLGRIQQSGDSDAWQHLFKLYAPLIRKWLSRYHIQGADADDLVQEVLTAVSQELSDFDHNQRTGAFRRWLRTILVFRVQSYWRRRQRQPPAQGGSNVLDELQQLEDENSGLSRIWNEQHDRDVMERLLQIVRPKFEARTWEAFHRQIFGQQKPAEIAKELGLELGSVYMARNRVLGALRKEAAGIVDTI